VACTMTHRALAAIVSRPAAPWTSNIWRALVFYHRLSFHSAIGFSTRYRISTSCASIHASTIAKCRRIICPSLAFLRFPLSARVSVLFSGACGGRSPRTCRTVSASYDEPSYLDAFDSVVARSSFYGLYSSYSLHPSGSQLP